MRGGGKWSLLGVLCASDISFLNVKLGRRLPESAASSGAVVASAELQRQGGGLRHSLGGVRTDEGGRVGVLSLTYILRGERVHFVKTF